MKRRCKFCGQVKSIKEFYYRKDTGHFREECKKCSIEISKEWYKNNLGYHKEWYKNNPDKVIAGRIKRREHQANYYREWYRKHGRKRAENYTEITKQWRKLNPEKVKVKNLVGIAIKSGKIKRPKICSICGKERRLNAHHSDYNFSLKVKWLCHSCHKKEHIKNRCQQEKP